MKARLAIVIAVASIALVVAAHALAVGPPDQLSPGDDASFTSGDPISFTASVTDPPFPDEMDFYISDEPPTFGANGVISNSINVLHGGSNGGDPVAVYTASPSPNADWPKKPGTYHWQAVYVDCGQEDPPNCFYKSATTPSFTVNPRPASSVSVANPPDTFLNDHPRRRVHQRKARFAFSSDVAGAHFQCLYAKGWAACKSPHIFRHLEPGRYRFQARAVVNGVEDPSPASWTFRVRKRPNGASTGFSLHRR